MTLKCSSPLQAIKFRVKNPNGYLALRDAQGLDESQAHPQSESGTNPQANLGHSSTPGVWRWTNWRCSHFWGSKGTSKWCLVEKPQRKVPSMLGCWTHDLQLPGSGLQRLQGSSPSRPLPKQLWACFSRTAFPAIRVGTPIRRTCHIGKFHGIMDRITPSVFRCQIKMALVTIQ